MDRKGMYFFVILLTILSVLTSTSASAERVEPTGRDTPVTATFDKGNLPSNIQVWEKESGGYDTSIPGLWGRNSWVCLSNSSTETGKCPTLPQWGGSGDISIPITFTEKRSGMKQILNMKTEHRLKYPNGSGCGEYASSNPMVYSAMLAGCQGGDGTSESVLSAYFTAAELAKLPAGGVWQANLKMVLMQWDNPRNYPLANWNAYITLNVTDTNNQQIYLPEFGDAAPVVNLNMRPLPGTGINKVSVEGSANIDVCLYDGYNANSSTFMLTLNDDFTGQQNRSAIYFSIVRQGGNVNDSRDRIDYSIKILNPDTNTLQTVTRARQMSFTKIQQANIRQVHLPGIPEPVICVPAPLELNTGLFEVSSKNAGYYRGILQVNFTPSLY